MDTGDIGEKSDPAVQPGSKEEYQQAWTELYILTEHWKSDMNFFNDELNFLNILIDRYFMKLTEEAENVSKIRPVASTLSRVEARARELHQKITKHLRHIQELMENPFSHDSQPFKDEHEKLENAMATFIKDFRAIKRDVFTLTEQVLRSEKAKHLLGAASV